MVERKWEFVTVDRPAAQQNAATRKRVRVGAMRAFRRKETLERIEAFQREKMTGSIAQDSSPTDSALSRRGSSATDRFQPSAEVSFRSVAAMPRSIVPHRDSLTCTSDRDHASGSFDFVVEKKDLGYLPGLPEIKTLDPCGTRSLGLNNSQHFLLHHCKSLMATSLQMLITITQLHQSCLYGLFDSRLRKSKAQLVPHGLVTFSKTRSSLTQRYSMRRFILIISASDLQVL